MSGTLTRLFCIASVLFLGMGGRCQAGFITTVFASNNQVAASGGNFFDVSVGGSALSVTSLELNVMGQAGQIFGISVYDKVGTYLGSEQNISAWTLVSTGTGVCSGVVDSPELVSLNSRISMQSQSTYGWFVAITTQNSGDYLEYTYGTGSNQVYSNADLSLSTGASESSYFGQLFSPSSKVFQNRVWNGEMEYTVVPEPSSLAMCEIAGVLGLIGVRVRRKRAG